MTCEEAEQAEGASRKPRARMTGADHMHKKQGRQEWRANLKGKCEGARMKDRHDRGWLRS